MSKERLTNGDEPIHLIAIFWPISFANINIYRKRMIGFLKTSQRCMQRVAIDSNCQEVFSNRGILVSTFV
ncbi:unnamed protein product [Acanthoscelides obtectus]|uniref:Uncharacterized protein n=1 Tax=Acanthoscelides obtectus TaxID=200917 RepID=A0A9P0K8V0_ACAOB|nr:unnamed protein product [Acanthoscelides obtectus]CAK1633508.1 hypothetical protein AOBTE_LOCUS8183 [Acanthoscelides obtectus]